VENPASGGENLAPFRFVMSPLPAYCGTSLEERVAAGRG